MLQITKELSLFWTTQFSQQRIQTNLVNYAQPRFSRLDQFTGKTFSIKKNIWFFALSLYILPPIIWPITHYANLQMLAIWPLIIWNHIFVHCLPNKHNFTFTLQPKKIITHIRLRLQWKLHVIKILLVITNSEIFWGAVWFPQNLLYHIFNIQI